MYDSTAVQDYLYICDMSGKGGLQMQNTAVSQPAGQQDRYDC